MNSGRVKKSLPRPQQPFSNLDDENLLPESDIFDDENLLTDKNKTQFPQIKTKTSLHAPTFFQSVLSFIWPTETTTTAMTVTEEAQVLRVSRSTKRVLFKIPVLYEFLGLETLLKLEKALGYSRILRKEPLLIKAVKRQYLI